MQEIQLGNITVRDCKGYKESSLVFIRHMAWVTIAAPLEWWSTIRIYAISKLSWIRKQQAKIKAQKRIAKGIPNQESHYYLERDIYWTHRG
jgi:predicted metal-dependent hydrolase